MYDPLVTSMIMGDIVEKFIIEIMLRSTIVLWPNVVVLEEVLVESGIERCTIIRYTLTKLPR